AGEQLLAYDVLSAGLERFPDDVTLTQRAALALARSGATGRANDMLRALLARDASDEQTLGLLARTEKDLWTQAADPAAGARHLAEAAAYYRRAYAIAVERRRPPEDVAWAGSNAAATGALPRERAPAVASGGEVPHL